MNNIKEIPLIIPNYNQFSYLRNLVNQFHFFYPENKIYVLDNGSTYKPLLDYYWQNEEITVLKYPENDFVKNLTNFLAENPFEYYLISDPDISIHPSTPPFFLEIFYELIEHQKYHHVGFDLIYDDIPVWNAKAGWIAGDEAALHQVPLQFKYNDYVFTGYKAPIDTTFCLFSSHNGGWVSPMTGENWGNSLRIFQALHLPWYQHPEYINDEMKHYYSTCRKFEPGMASAGLNNHRPY